MWKAGKEEVPLVFSRFPAFPIGLNSRRGVVLAVQDEVIAVRVFEAAGSYGLMVTLRMRRGVSGWLMAPSAPRVVGDSAMASPTSKPRITLAKIT